MKKLYAGIAATALAATGLACSAGAAQAGATTPGWSSTFGADPGDSRVSLAVASDAAYAAWPDSNDSIIDVTTTALSGDHATTLDALTVEGHVSGTAVTSTGLLVATVNPDGGGVPELFVSDAGDLGSPIPLNGFDHVDGVTVSPDGDWAVVVGTETDTQTTVLAAEVVSVSEPGAESLVPLPDVTEGRAVEVSDTGTAYAAVERDGTNELWSISDTTAVEVTDLPAGRPAALAVLANDTVAVGINNDATDGGADDTAEIAYVVDGQIDHAVTLDEMGSVTGLATSGQTIWAYNDGGVLSRIDGTRAQTFVTTYGALWNAAPASDGNTLYIAGADWDQGAETDGPASLFAVTAPAAPSGLWDSANDDSTISVGWTPAAGTEDDVDYRVTLTDQATGEAHTGTAYKDSVTSTYAATNVAGVDPSHRYDVRVEAFNGAFYSTALTGVYLPVVPGEGQLSITGSTTVGSTLTAHLTSTWPGTATLSYQWMIVQSEGESGGLVPIPGAAAQHESFVVTPDLRGERLAVQVTAHQDGFTDSFSESDLTAAITGPSTSGPAPTEQPTPPAPTQQPTPQPTQPAPTQPVPHATPAPVRVGPIRTTQVDVHDTRITLQAPGVTRAPGTVKVFAGNKLIGTATIKNGKLVLHLDKHLSHGTHSIKLKYAGSAKVAKFNKSVKLKVA